MLLYETGYFSLRLYNQTHMVVILRFHYYYCVLLLILPFYQWDSFSHDLTTTQYTQCGTRVRIS